MYIYIYDCISYLGVMEGRLIENIICRKLLTMFAPGVCCVCVRCVCERERVVRVCGVCVRETEAFEHVRA